MYIVTGSLSGIGKSVYESLKKSDSVIGVDLNNSDIICDLSVEENVKKITPQIYALSDNISGVVTCAGVIGGENIVPLNYFGSVRLVENLYMQYGYVNAILIGSIIFTQAKVNDNLISLLLSNKEKEAVAYCKNNKLTDTEVYSTCKFALNLWSRNFIKNNTNARVNVIHPSLTKTGMTEDYLKSEVVKIIFSENINKAYLGGPEEVSDLVCYLIKNSKSVNGQSIFVDNGVYEH
jgi:NAD(P)-dependent dehydrogenase (short-subunit alcohol dehydrogenase family)